jgi:peptide/nickel transport system permease protein
MRRFVSPAALLFLIFLSFAEPSALGLPEPDAAAAPPWSKPEWLDKSEAPTVSLRVNSGTPIQNLSWSWNAPLNFAITGRLSGSLIWKTPEKDFTLAKTTVETTLDINGNDMSFKRALGERPFASMPGVLFPKAGEYELSMAGNGDVTFRVDGGRWGWLGADQRGRDVASLFVRGVRVSLIVGLSATLIATLLGTTFGLLSGYAGGVLDALIMRTVDVLLSIPTLPILMVMAGILGKSLLTLVLILSLFSWMGTARMVRAVAMSLRDAPWVENLRALGAKRNYIIFRHLLPEAMPLLLANIALGVPGVILAEAGLSFLGLSDPRLPSWGRMLHEAHA